MAGTATRIALVALLAACLGLGAYVIGSERGQRNADAGTVSGVTGTGADPARAARPTKSAEPTAPALPTRTTTSAGRCDGALVNEKVREVTVPAGAHCVLVATTVDSNVSVGHGSVLEMQGSRVGGDVEGEGSHTVTASRSVMSGNVQLEGGGTATLTDSHVGGDVEWQEQHGPLVVRSTTVSGNLKAEDSTGGVTIDHNRVGGDLECSENRPAPTGGDNAVSGNRAEQCHGM